MRRFLVTAALITVAHVAAPMPVIAQGVLVAPHAIFVDHRTRSGWIQLHNPGAEPVEVDVSATFGFPVTDSMGNLELRIIEEPDSTLPSALGWIQAFPRRVLVPGQGRQTVRLLARPPAELPDGEYWSRIIVSAKAGTIPVTTTDSTRDDITIGLALEVRTIVPLIYRKGGVQSGVQIDSVRATLEPDSVVVRAQLTRVGGGAWLGTVRGRLVPASGRGDPVASFEVPISVYYRIDPRFTLPRAGIPAGDYRLELDLSSDRADIAPEYLLQSAPVRTAVSVRLP